jgi:hypothetical protein
MIGISRTVRLTGPLFAIVLVACVAFAADNAPPSAKKVISKGETQSPVDWAKSIKVQTGIDVDLAGVDARPVTVDKGTHDFWVALETLAKKTNSRIAFSAGRLTLKPGKSHSSSCVRGPFRFSVREIDIRGDAENGTANYSVTLNVSWEPWLLAYRSDSSPTIRRATSDQGKELLVAKGGSRSLTTGNSAALSVRPSVDRPSKSITLEGSVGITIADELLTFTFDANKPEPTAAQKGVSAAVKKSAADGPDWIVEIELRHEKGKVSVESYEYELYRNNVLELVSPRGDRFKMPVAEYRDRSTVFSLKNGARQVGPGWKLEYRTPGPMREIVVPFELKDIRLP